MSNVFIINLFLIHRIAILAKDIQVFVHHLITLIVLTIIITVPTQEHPTLDFVFIMLMKEPRFILRNVNMSKGVENVDDSFLDQVHKHCKILLFF